MLRISSYASEENFLIYLIGDLTKSNLQTYEKEVNHLIKEVKIKNVIFKSSYLNKIDESGLTEIIKTLNFAQRN